ncbi:DUF3341 domain-containing protein [Pajaroellobacter abortibovis]|uniref:DUF3341 domain-containing protein n=1 Tax=Pajaroellobacter abortibovis TaxID=1882918 RepID=A0A1L6MVA8_9BACT|nr:DUF3341 domain-containing protein [Pajaroellobacter abortibovis]APR99442.1 hypothetical protein BCY86_01150 [Pajaroellobacter abortibovis]
MEPSLELAQSPAPRTAANAPKKPALLLAEFDTAEDIVHAAEKVKTAGYQNWDIHTPFPVHGMDAAMGLSDSKLGWIVLAAGLTGCLSAALLIWWTNGIDYPLIVGGKPPASIPTMVPVCFEFTILFSAFGAVFGMFYLNRLPRHYHPIFESERFLAATSHKFFLSIEVCDPKFDLEKSRLLLESARAKYVEVLEEGA